MDLPSRVITRGLRFPEGPIAMPDGSVLLVEIAAGNLTRVLPDGGKEVVAHLGGGPNGAAIGPDGKCYVCNNGGFEWGESASGYLRPISRANDYVTGRIERVDLATGAAEVLYSECDGVSLKGPNDIVFDTHGGFYFTDLGKSYGRLMDRGAVYYARADGSAITEIAFPVTTPNGVGLSPDGKVLYVAETETSRLWAWDILEPGMVRKDPWPSPHGGHLVAGLPGYQRFDSLAVEADGNICVATLIRGGVSVISPAGELVGFWESADAYCTNICFGGADLRTAYVTLSGTGVLVALDWPRPGLLLNDPATAGH